MNAVTDILKKLIGYAKLATHNTAKFVQVVINLQEEHYD